MIRLALAVPVLLLLAACGKAASESDDPKPTQGSAHEQTRTAIAQASTAAAGEPPAAFRQCSVCHATEADRNLIGPSLAGVYGKRAGSVPGFNYSAALKQSNLTWDDASLDRFLAAPMSVMPGTRMTYAGLKDSAARREVIGYLKTL